jgi:WhiB family redox-sensing transcriptional regulator
VGWQEFGLCRKVEGINFFPESRDGPRAADAAKKICGACFVRAQCLDEALRYDEHGVWGGTTEKERRVIKDRYVRVKGPKALYRTIHQV